jgi:hypothetical protein
VPLALSRLPRFRAIFLIKKELNIEKVPVRILKSENELFDFRVSLIENLQRKNLSDPEIALAIKEYDEMKRKFEGEKDTKFKGKDRFGRHIVASEEGWTQEKTAEDLNISRQAVTKAIQIATAVEEYPELAKMKCKVGNFNFPILEFRKLDEFSILKGRQGVYFQGLMIQGTTD